MGRVTAQQRIQMANVAEREVMRYAGDHALWHKHVHNVELDPVQVLKMVEMDEHAFTIDFASRRTGKTACKELHDLEFLACNADQELGIVAPREAQSVVNLNYHLDAIRRSEILSAFIAVKSGRRQMADTYYQFANRSRAQAYGVMANVDGGDLTVASLEEVDDMPKDRLFSRFLLMLGASRRLGADQESRNEPRVRITGVFKGADTLTDLLDSGEYFAIGCFHGEAARSEIERLIELGELAPEEVELESYSYPVPVAHAVNAIDLGLLNAGFIEQMKGQLARDEYIRQLLCINTSSRNLIWERFIRRALQVGLEAGLELACPTPGEEYRKRGLISFGYDHSGHGERPDASRYALVVLELIGNFVCVVFCRTWMPGTDEQVVARDLVGLWRYFRPDVAHGDAYGIGLLTAVNDDLYRQGLTHIDRRTIGDGESTASTWGEWPFSPVRFEGMTKHSMAQATRAVFHNRQAAIPYFDDQDPEDPETADLRMLVRQLGNMRAEETRASYSSYKMVRDELGDDLFDACIAAVWGLVTRGVAPGPGRVLMTRRSRDELMDDGIRMPELETVQ